MKNSAQHQSWTINVGFGPATAALAIAIVFALTALVTPFAQAQTFTVLHNFTGGADGASPAAGLVMDKAGNLYGTASAGGAGYGTVFKLTHTGGGWIVNPIYQFQGGSDGAIPLAALVFGPDGSLYGTTEIGGNNVCQYVGGATGCGTVFNLKPPPNRPKSFANPWVETVIYRFGFYTDGAQPYSEVLFDAAGNLYGTTAAGGPNDDHDGIDGGGGCGYHCGTVYELSPSNGGWAETTIFAFSEDSSANPQAGLVFDQAGNLYGVTADEGQEGMGSIFQLQPSGSGWTERTLHSMQWGEGTNVYSTLVMDAAGNLYGGNTGYSGYYGTYNGNVFTLTPNGQSWSFSSLYSFPAKDGPYGSLTMGAAGNLYGTTSIGGANNYGEVFKLTPFNGGWNYTSLHDFIGSDGCNSTGKIILDAKGNLYGTTSSCGASSHGNVWEITP